MFRKVPPASKSILAGASPGAIMKRMLVLVCLSILVMIGCSQTQTQTATLQEQCSAGSKAACEELARTQQPSYEEQPQSGLQESQPTIPSPATATPPARHAP
jgi:hypothetical protein